MSGWKKWTLQALGIAAAIAFGLLVAQPEAQQKNVLVSKKVAAGPTVDGTMKDAYQSVPPLAVKVVGGKNLPGGSTAVTIRSVHTDDMVYFLIQYKDATQSLQRAPWKKQSDGSWVKLKDPNDKGGDNNLYYEDKLAILWNISSPAFEQKGCMSACHTGEGKPYGNMYTASAGERLDNWHWKTVRTGPVGQADDQYIDNTRYDKEKAPEAGRKSDPKTSGGYVDNFSDDKKAPKFALPGNKPAPPYWIMDAEKEPFDDSRYKPGDEVPGIVIAPFVGDRGDLQAKGAWNDGTWTVEIARKKLTNSQFDVQFEGKKEYAFGIAVFDNASVRHAYNPGVLKMVFE